MPEIEAHRQRLQEEAVSEVQDPPRAVRVITREEAGDDLMAGQDYTTHQEFARHEVFDRERDEKVTRLESVFASHLKDYDELRADVKAGNATGRRIENKLNNGISERLKRLDDNAVDADKVRAIIHGEAAGAKKRGREWLTVICGLCVVAVSVLGFLL